MEILMNLDFLETVRQLTPSLLRGFGVVIQATLLGFVLALIIGMLIAIGRISSNKLLNAILVGFVELIRGTPLLVQLVYIYYVVPLLLEILCYLFGYKANIQFSSLSSGIAGLGISYGCYISEVIRASILSIDKGQTEASLALGFGNSQTLFRIVIPLAIHNVIPSLGNFLVMMVKDTSLLAYVTVNELLLRTQTYASQTFNTIESYTLLAVCYLIISVPLSRLVRQLEIKLNRKKRS